jgi:hypothetical protein
MNSLTIPSCTCFCAKYQGSVSPKHLLQPRPPVPCREVCVWAHIDFPWPCFSHIMHGLVLHDNTAQPQGEQVLGCMVTQLLSDGL